MDSSSNGKNHSVEILIDNEREWRRYTLEKILQLDQKLEAKIVSLDSKLDAVDKELSTFKVRVFTIASIIGGAGGVSAEWIIKIFKGL